MIRLIWVTVVGWVATFVWASYVLWGSLFRVRCMSCVCERACREWSRWILWASNVTVRMEGTELFQRQEGPWILVANHESWYDVWALATHLPLHYRFVAKEELSRVPLFGYAWVRCGHVSINRGDRGSAVASLEEALKRVRDDRIAMILFPEGTRSPDGNLLPFKKGAFVLALQSGIPIVPVGVQGGRQILPKGSFRVRSGEMVIRVGDPIPVEGLGMKDRDALLAQAREAVGRLKEEGELPRSQV
ncbi:MAG: lysophospholipid acyltransferase family protein [Gemmatimonadota bacterium]